MLSHDPDARITKMKDGRRTHLAHKAEHAVDMETGALVAVPLHGADEGDTATIPETVAEAGEHITAVLEDAEDGKAVKQVSVDGPREVVTDKGYHSRQVVPPNSSSCSRSISLLTGSNKQKPRFCTRFVTSGCIKFRCRTD
jgi:hypothetical protein